MKFLKEVVITVIILVLINIAIAINGYFRGDTYTESAINVLIVIVAMYLGVYYANKFTRKG